MRHRSDRGREGESDDWPAGETVLQYRKVTAPQEEGGGQEQTESGDRGEAGRETGGEIGSRRRSTSTVQCGDIGIHRVSAREEPGRSGRYAGGLNIPGPAHSEPGPDRIGLDPVVLFVIVYKII